MKCRECNCCRRGWFESRPEAYVCVGVLEPFVIEDIDVECTEYLERRNKAVKNISVQDAISHFKYGISHDIFSEPVTSYAKMAVEALEKKTQKKIVLDGDDESDYVYCPCCNKCIGVNELVWHDFWCRDFTPMHCQECGQTIVWK